jgi:3-oxo-5-alpha-steroid 4-dehydrogenase 1
MLPWIPSRLLHPAWMFVLFEISAMLPRAISGQAWYRNTFGDRYPKTRKIVFPWVY